MNLKAENQNESSNSVNERILSLRDLGLFKPSHRDPYLDSLTQLACNLCETKMAAVSILEKDFLWIQSSVNFSESEISREDSVCFHALNANDIFEVEDLSNDGRFENKSFVLNDPKIRSYAGAPLKTKEGVKIGFLCVLDTKPKKLTPSQRGYLETIAKQVMFIIETGKLSIQNSQAQQKLEESQVYHSAVINNVTSLIYIKNAQKDMTYSMMNPACQKIFGVTESQVLGRKDSDFLPKQLSGLLRASDQSVFSSSEIVKIEKEELPTPLGQRFFTTYKIPIFDENNRPKMLIVIMRDITEEIYAKAALEQERMKCIHSAKLASIGEISAGVAHEINNPLAVLAGSISLLEQLRENPENFAAKIKTVFRSIERIVKIVNNLKKFSRYNENPIFNFVSVSSIVKEALEMIEAKARLLSIELRTDIQQVRPIFCSDLEIEQVIVNLVNNSIDAIRNLPEKWIEVSSFELQGRVILRVQDSGKGICPEIEKKLFEPFFTTKPLGEGTGLGLSISKDIVTRHQATLTLNHQFPNTCFEISFPAVQSESHAS